MRSGKENLFMSLNLGEKKKKRWKKALKCCFFNFRGITTFSIFLSKRDRSTISFLYMKHDFSFLNLGLMMIVGVKSSLSNGSTTSGQTHCIGFTTG